MFLRLEAPVPAIASTILLPSPEIGNNLGLQSQVQIIKMMDGSKRTFIKRAGEKRRHRYNVVVSSEKRAELEDFVRRYRDSVIRAVWRDRKVEGYMTLNPVESVGVGREAYSITLEFVER